MKAFHNIEESVEQAFKSLEDLEPAQANPYLFTRIEQRIKNSEQSNLLGSWMYKLAVVLILFISMNAYTYSKFSPTDAGTSSSSSSTGIEAFANEYGLEQSADQI